MPTARPSISASAGVIEFISKNAVAAMAPSRPAPTPSEGDEQGQAGGDEAAEHHEQDCRGDGEADDLTDADDAARLEDVGVVVDAQSLLLELLADLGDLGADLGWELGDRGVELDLEHRRAAVRAEEAQAIGEGELPLTLAELEARLLDLGVAVVELGLDLRVALDPRRNLVAQHARLLARALSGFLEGGELCARGGEVALTLVVEPVALLELVVLGLELLLAVLDLRAGVVERLLGLEGVHHRLDMRCLLPVGQGALDRDALGRRDGTGLVLDRDGADPACGSRDLTPERAQHGLELGAGDADGRGRGSGHGRHRTAESDEQQEPGGEGGPGVPGGESAEAIEEQCHVRPPGCGLQGRRRR